VVFGRIVVLFLLSSSENRGAPCLNDRSCFSGGSVPAELGEMDGRNVAAATVGLVNGKYLLLCLFILSYYVPVEFKIMFTI
jgi:hypothetical protein